MYPDLLESPEPKPAPSTKLIQSHRIAWTKLVSNTSLIAELRAVSAYVGFDVVQRPSNGVDIQRWGKFKLQGGNVLQSRLSKERSTPTRRSEWFEAHSGLKEPQSGPNLVYGHAQAFYKISRRLGDTTQPITLVVYTPLVEVKNTCGFPRGSWSKDGRLEVMNVSFIRSLVGIWLGINTRQVYILRKHPGLAYLSTDERGFQEGDDEDDEDDFED